MQKNALVTGASEGIGRALAKKLAAQGYVLTLVARNQERLGSLSQELQGSGHKIVTADLANTEGIQKIAALFSQDHYDLLVNNAGQGVHGNFSELEIDQLLNIFHLNCESLIMLSHAFLKYAKAGDALVNVSSTLAFLARPGSATYCGTKSFVTAFSEALWYEEKTRGVYVMNFCPGLTKTEFFVRAGGNRKQPPEALFQSAEDVADEMLHALKKRSEPTVISGRRNQALAFLTRVFTRRKVVKLMGTMK